MCLECGFYKGRMVMDMQAKKEAREARLQAKRDMLKAQSDQEAVDNTANETPAETESTPAVEGETKETDSK